MKGALILSAIVVAVTASAEAEANPQGFNPLCPQPVYNFCCNGIISPFKRQEPIDRSVCVFCDCPPQQQPTTRSTTAATTPATTPSTTRSTTQATTPVTTPSTTRATTPSTTPSTTPATTPSTTPSTTVRTTSASSSAAPQPSAGSCLAAGNGAVLDGYTTSCGTDYPGGDLSNAPSSSFSGCTAQCNRLPGCVGFSYVGGNNAGVCYFKSSQTNPVANPNVDSGFRPSPVIPSQSTTSSAAPSTTASTTSASTTSASTTTGVSTTTSAAPQPTASGSCQALVANPPAGYTISCQTDRPGGDLSNAPASSFAGCVPQCNALAGCVGFAYVGGNNAGVCYFKSSLTGGSPNANVDFGARNNVPSSSSSSSRPATTTTAAPTFTCLCPQQTSVF